MQALGDPDLGTTVTPTLMSSGTSANTVPALAELAVDVRVRDVEEQRRVDHALRSLRPVLPDVRLELVGGPNRPPLAADASARLFGRAAAAVSTPVYWRPELGPGDVVSGPAVMTLPNLATSPVATNATADRTLTIKKTTVRNSRSGISLVMGRVSSTS